MPTYTVELRYGYTLADLHEMAASACRADRSLASDAHTRYDVAWSAIAEHLCAAEGPPERHDLVRVGWQAIYREVREMRVMFGFKDRDGTTETASAPRFRAYWHHGPQHMEDAIVERLAVPEVIAAVPEVYRAALIALAVHGDYQAAADALGLKYSTLTMRLTVARKTARRLWFAPETAPPVKGTDRRIGSRDRELPKFCRGGNGPHEMTPENTYRRPNPKPGRRGERVCRACESERGRERWARRTATRSPEGCQVVTEGTP